MAHALALPHDEREHPVDTPIVDFLYHDSARRAYVVTFIPEDSASKSETEVVEISDGDVNALRIQMQLKHLADVLKSKYPIDRVTHAGGDNFEIQFEGGNYRGINTNRALGAVRCLQDIAMTAQVVFILGKKDNTQEIRRASASKLKGARIKQSMRKFKTEPTVGVRHVPAQ